MPCPTHHAGRLRKSHSIRPPSSLQQTSLPVASSLAEDEEMLTYSPTTIATDVRSAATPFVKTGESSQRATRAHRCSFLLPKGFRIVERGGTRARTLLRRATKHRCCVQALLHSRFRSSAPRCGIWLRIQGQGSDSLGVSVL